MQDRYVCENVFEKGYSAGERSAVSHWCGAAACRCRGMNDELGPRGFFCILGR